MEAEDAAEMMDQEQEKNRFKQRAAIVIAFFAMMLAITGLGGQNAANNALHANVQAANLFSFYQAKNQRQTAYELAGDAFELVFLDDPSLPEATRSTLKARLEKYRRTVARYESEPATQEGKVELLARARAAELERDHALRQNPYFDYAEALLQIAIVLISVAIIAEQGWLALGAGALGLLGALLTANGFLLLVDIPGFG